MAILDNYLELADNETITGASPLTPADEIDLVGTNILDGEDLTFYAYVGDTVPNNCTTMWLEIWADSDSAFGTEVKIAEGPQKTRATDLASIGDEIGVITLKRPGYRYLRAKIAHTGGTNPAAGSYNIYLTHAQQSERQAFTDPRSFDSA